MCLSVNVALLKGDVGVAAAKSDCLTVWRNHLKKKERLTQCLDSVMPKCSQSAYLIIYLQEVAAP